MWCCLDSGWGCGVGFLRVGGCVCMCREPIVLHDVVYGVQFFFVFVVF